MQRIKGSIPAVVVAFVMFSGAFSTGAEALRRYDTEKIVQVNIKTGDQLKAVESLGVTILNCHPGVGPMDVLVTPAQLSALERLGLSSTMLVEDVQALVDRDRSAPARGDPFADFFLDYHPYGDAATVGSIVWYMNELVARYPNLMRMVNIGLTLEGRTIWGVRIANDAVVEDKPAVVYFGTEHAREWVATTVPSYFATQLVINYGIDDQITDLVDHVEFFLIPVFNPDGFIYSWNTDRFWRKNAGTTAAVPLASISTVTGRRGGAVRDRPAIRRARSIVARVRFRSRRRRCCVIFSWTTRTFARSSISTVTLS